MPAIDPVTDPATDSPPRSRRRQWMVLGVLVVLALAAAGYFLGQGGGSAGGKDRTVGGIAPDIKLPEVRGNGGDVVLASYRGKPVVVNFFASWCVPCRKEMAAFQSVSTRVGDRVSFVGIDHQDNRAGGQQLLADTGVRYPTGYDPDGTMAARYGLFGMPTTVFISPEGKILEKHTGEMSEAALTDAISRLFGIMP